MYKFLCGDPGQVTLVSVERLLEISWKLSPLMVLLSQFCIQDGL